MEIIQTTLAFVFALGVLIFVHEYGHFWVARRCGVKVLRFSIGFGKPLWSRFDKHGTEFTVSAIPLGGYVRMLDEREGEVPAELLSQTFNRKSVLQRIAIVGAGPLVNLVFAVLLYWVMFMSGVAVTIPMVGDVHESSPAAQAGVYSGQEIVSVDGRETQSWEDVIFALISRIGDSGEITLGLKSPDSTMIEERAVLVDRWLVGSELDSPLAQLGIDPMMPGFEPVLGEVVPGGAADKAGLLMGDKIQAADGEIIDSWSQWVAIIRANPEKPLLLNVERDHSRIELTVVPARVNNETGEAIGRIGARVSVPDDYGAEYQRIIRYGPLAALLPAFTKMWDRSVLTLGSIGKMLQGLISIDNISGPITIAKIAGQTASYGPEAFFSFIAYLSISLGVLNLLPIPVLDGGHLLYYFVELIKGSPVSERIQAAGAKMGMALLLAFMMLAIFNDIARL
ncbi:MAG: sigma E protease regulator RseP [Pseudomonadales bacterium]|nr:sigma E protease regulator RseP [Pseudomonadales bacterium]